MRNYLYIFGVFILLLSYSFCPVHALKISTSEILQKDKNLQIKIKLFADDLGSGLSQICKKNVPLEGASIDKQTLLALNPYIFKNFQISVNNAEVKMLFKKSLIEEDQAAGTKIVWLFYEVGNVGNQKIKTMALRNTLLFDAIPEQKNISTVKLFQEENTKTILFENQNGDSIKQIQF